MAAVDKISQNLGKIKKMAVKGKFLRQQKIAVKKKVQGKLKGKKIYRKEKKLGKIKRKWHERKKFRENKK